MNDRKSRQQALYDTLATRIVVMDGAMGSILHSQLTIADYGGSHLENCTDNVCRTRPDLIADIHKQYLDAGAADYRDQLVQRPPALDGRISVAGRDCTRSTTPRRRSPARPRTNTGRTRSRRFVAGSMGPDHASRLRSPATSRFEDLTRRLLRAGQGAGRGRRGHPAARDLPGHAQRQGGAARHRDAAKESSAARSR